VSLRVVLFLLLGLVLLTGHELEGEEHVAAVGLAHLLKDLAVVDLPDLAQVGAFGVEYHHSWLFGLLVFVFPPAAPQGLVIGGILLLVEELLCLQVVQLMRAFLSSRADPQRQ
jgi:hypothetical protein